MIGHYCKVNGVRRRQAESDWKQALPAKDPIPDRHTTTMDFGPFEYEVALVPLCNEFDRFIAADHM